MPPARRSPNDAAPALDEGRQYVLGVNDAEVARLGFQHQLWSHAAHALWERAGLNRGDRVLDVGCGPGFTSVDLAHCVGAQGAVIAVDEAPMYIETLDATRCALGLMHVRPVLGDVQRLDLAGVDDASLDFAYARWVLCFVPHPERVVEGVARLLRPGGVFAVQDYFNYEAMTIAPRSDAFTHAVEAVARSWRKRGGDPDVMGRMPGVLRAHGFDVLEIRPNLRVARPGTLLWGWPDTFFRNFLPQLERMGEITADERIAFEREWDARSQDPASFVSTPPVYDVIARKR